MKRVLFGLICLTLTFGFSVMADDLQAKDFGNISVKELKAKIDAGEKLFLLNPLSDIEFNEGHIPGSVNVPLHAVHNTDKLPKDKSTLIITYCKGRK